MKKENAITWLQLVRYIITAVLGALSGAGLHALV